MAVHNKKMKKRVLRNMECCCTIGYMLVRASRKKKERENVSIRCEGGCIAPCAYSKPICISLGLINNNHNTSSNNRHVLIATKSSCDNRLYVLHIAPVMLCSYSKRVAIYHRDIHGKEFCYHVVPVVTLIKK